MNQLLKKTWLLFYILAVSGLLVLSMSLYFKHGEFEYEIQSEQRYVTKIFESYISSTFIQFESILDLIAHESTIHQGLDDDIIQYVLAEDSFLIGFALFDSNGKMQSTSNNLQDIQFPYFANTKNLDQWIKQALLRSGMIISPPYYLKEHRNWVNPIQKRIADPHGEVMGVITSAIDLQALSLHWNDDSNGRRIMQATLDDGFYRILRSNLALNKYEQIYQSSVPDDFSKQVENKINLQNLTLDDLRQSGDSVQVKMQDDQFNYVTLVFNKKLKTWFSALESNHALFERMQQVFLIYSAFYLVIFVIIFFLFKWIIRIEKNKLYELTFRAEHDPLTGLYNRSILKSKNLKYNKRNQPFSLLYIDLDHFKSINDSYGYSYGDIILVEVSKRITSTVSSDSTITVRLSADEFILLIDSTDKNIVEYHCKTLLKAIALPYVVNNTDFKVSASIGIAQSPLNATDIETLIGYANNSMLIAKKSKNDFVFFSEKIHLQLIKNIEMEQALHNALDKNEISLVYQPQLDSNHQLYGVEALVRWNNPILGFVSPDVFIPIAEKTGLMPELGAYIMHKAMHDISRLQFKIKNAFKLSINVSARQFVQLNFFEALSECLNSYKSPYLDITIEITESLFIENIYRLTPIFKKMKEQSISLSLDDFGTGYSSLSMLKNVPIDELKIDKSFVDHIVENNNERAMVESIITMGKNLGMTVLAEGVETQQQATILQNSGCDLYQGYYFSKPLTLEDLEAYILKQN